ncbi:MAG: hypothetical protein BWX72_00045 [Firmicutes bacterium ADurb.Bin080]|nr:MAG: hypothetical protein BWX72_00045 [Firmicutes bacterium ADurb.Bin080]
MKPNDPYQTAELFTQDDFKTYLQCGWTLLDIRAGNDAYPVIYLVKKEMNSENNEKDKNKP